MKRFNLNEFIWFLILIGLDTMLLYLIKTGRLSNFIHPKMHKYIYFAIALLLLMIFVQAFKIFTIPDRGGVKKDYAVFMFAILALTLSATWKFAISEVSLRDVRLTTRSYWEETGDQHTHENFIPNGEIDMSGENFYCYLEDIEKNLKFYKGRNIKVKGILLNNNAMNEREYVIARMVMSCCAADSQAFGIKCIIDKQIDLEDRWVEVKGVIDIGQIVENKKIKLIPVIRVNSIYTIERPKENFIYQK